MEKWTKKQTIDKDTDMTNVVEMPAAPAADAAVEKNILVQDPQTGQVIGRAATNEEARAMTAAYLEDKRQAA